MTEKEKIELSNECLNILKACGRRGKGLYPRAMAAYQVLEHCASKNKLLSEFGQPGKGSTNYFSAAQVVSRALMRLERCGLVEFHYVTSSGMYFIVDGKIVEPGYQVVAFYQLTARGMSANHIYKDEKENIFVVVNSNTVEVQRYTDTPDREETE